MNIFITGTSRGIGNYLTNYYLNQGFNVFGCSRSEIELRHNNYYHFIADVSEEKDVKRIIDYFLANNISIDVLINNAGIASMNLTYLTPFETVKKIFSTNFYGTYLFSRYFVRILKKSSNPRIVNFTTVAVPLNLEGEAIYSSSKSAVEQLTKVMAKELAPFNITVNAIGPSPVKTDLIKGITAQKIEKLNNSLTLKKFTEFDDIVNILDFFINKRSKNITSQIIYLGGLSK